MIAIAMPVGSAHGWGICGKYLAREMAALTGGAARLLTTQFTPTDIGDELEFHALASLLMKREELAAVPVVDGVNRLPFPLLSCIADKRLLPAWPRLRGTRTVGYTFFEDNILDPAWIDNARRHFEVIATGSSWCSDVLKSHGLDNVHTVIQGVDPHIFFPWDRGIGFPDRGIGVPPMSPGTGTLPNSTQPSAEQTLLTNATGEPQVEILGNAAHAHRRDADATREFLRDRFVVFSGGKFEHRKGQDIVIRAVKVLQDRHPDVVLVNAWYNAWQASIDSMRISPHLAWPAQGVDGKNHVAAISHLLAHNGLDPARCITLAPRPNQLMARIYRNTDVGLFPNRCEGGTNLVLMEYMACAKPVVATATTGHADIITEHNALRIATRGEREITDAGIVVARWPEPDLDDAIAKLEWAYQNRPALATLASQAGNDLAALTWTKSAREFLKLLT